MDLPKSQNIRESQKANINTVSNPGPYSLETLLRKARNSAQNGKKASSSTARPRPPETPITQTCSPASLEMLPSQHRNQRHVVNISSRISQSNNMTPMMRWQHESAKEAPWVPQDSFIGGFVGFSSHPAMKMEMADTSSVMDNDGVSLIGENGSAYEWF
ncbi:hypothetical protein DL98DRAFT_595628 [Cadophora sp. DSE1049]|nr:hypothetical protein DL98DRAFT_595628 [Cadophora sp. DSE1049]